MGSDAFDELIAEIRNASMDELLSNIEAMYMRTSAEVLCLYDEVRNLNEVISKKNKEIAAKEAENAALKKRLAEAGL